MKILTKIAAILFLLPIVAGYAQAMPSLSFGLPTKNLEIDSAEPLPLDTATADFGRVETHENNASPDQTGISRSEAQAAAEAAYPGAKTLAMELDRVNEYGDALIYEIELDNGVEVEVDASNGHILGTGALDAH